MPAPLAATGAVRVNGEIYAYEAVDPENTERFNITLLGIGTITEPSDDLLAAIRADIAHQRAKRG